MSSSSSWPHRSAVLALALVTGCGRDAPQSRPGQRPLPPGLPASVKTCANCHELPPPDLLPKARWPRMLQGMNARIVKYALGAQLSAQDLRQVTHYYVSRAPESIEESEPLYASSPIQFQGVMLGEPPPTPGASVFQPPAIGDVLITDLDGDGHRDVLVSDDRANELRWIHRVGAETVGEDSLARLPAPARKEIADLDGDGRTDIVVACLGSIIPTMARVGQVALLHGEERGFSQRVLLGGVARVADVRIADLDRDGDLDVAYAAYGSYKMGEAGWLEQRGDGSFARRVLLERSGISHVPIADLDGDGALDLVALVSQEHEELLVFFGDGRGGFEPRTLFRAEHPMFGMAGIELADMDSDGDGDVVFANGDALDDDLFPKPWHGVRWLENAGGRRFELHEVVRFPGAYAVASGDVDGDGDRDLVATSMMNRWEDLSRQSVIWLENDGDKGFTPHALDASPTSLVTVDVGDLDGDGRADVVAGAFYQLESYRRVGRVTLWLNRGRR